MAGPNGIRWQGLASEKVLDKGSERLNRIDTLGTDLGSFSA